MFFSSGGGFPFGGFGGFDGQEEQNLYDLLGIERTATKEQLEEAYKKMLEDHKDDEQKTEQIKQAYQVLSDEASREAYDQQLDQQGKMVKNSAEILKMMGQQGKSSSKHKPKVKPKKHVIDVTLQQIYKGQTIKFDIKRYRVCEGCSGKGGQDVRQCKACDGQGATIKLIQIGPMMHQQIQQRCPDCKGQGEIFDEEKKCKMCTGEKVVEQQAKLTVALQKGTPHGYASVLVNQGDQLPQTEPGDVNVLFNLQKHDVFTVDKANLHIKKKITLTQALTGYLFHLTHLDTRGYRIQTHPGDVIADHSKKIVKGLGMPVFKKQGKFGDLIITFEIVMPQKINPDQYIELAKIIGGQLSKMPTNHNYEMLQDFDPEEMNTNEQGGRKQDPQQEQQGVTCGTG